MAGAEVSCALLVMGVCTKKLEGVRVHPHWRDHWVPWEWCGGRRGPHASTDWVWAVVWTPSVLCSSSSGQGAAAQWSQEVCFGLSVCGCGVGVGMGVWVAGKVCVDWLRVLVRARAVAEWMDAWMQCTAVSGRRLQAATREEKKKKRKGKKAHKHKQTPSVSPKTLSVVSSPRGNE